MLICCRLPAEEMELPDMVQRNTTRHLLQTQTCTSASYDTSSLPTPAQPGNTNGGLLFDVTAT